MIKSKLFYEQDNFKLFHGSNLDVLPTLPDNSVDSIVTDPPYELNFMNKGWDNTGIAFNIEMWKQCLRVLKPGGHMIAFSSARTYHRMAVAIEDAGFEIRDQIMWIYGASMPKGLNVKKKIEKSYGYSSFQQAMEEAKKWAGYNTVLKPTHEPMVLARKPLEKGLSIVQNLAKWGVGALNIGETKIEPHGRFPANVVIDDSEVIKNKFPETKKGGAIKKDYKVNNHVYGDMSMMTPKHIDGYDDAGSAARFFYSSKTTNGDRDEGLEDHKDVNVYSYEDVSYDSNGKKTSIKMSKQKYGYKNNNGDNFGDRIKNVTRKNIHTTVKPTDLMRWLVRLVTPKGGTLLDMFFGSGSTGKGAMVENILNDAKYTIWAIEMTDDYLPIARDRVIKGASIYAHNTINGKPKTKKVEEEQMSLF